MSEKSYVVRGPGEGERRWFLGGGLHVWKLTSEETDGAFFLFEDYLEEGKVTPYHRHPDASETLVLLEGTLLVRIGDQESVVETGSVVHFPKGVPHAFRVTSPNARMLCLQAPGKGEAFYKDATEPATDRPGTVDFKQIAEHARRTGAIEILGPPSFGR